MLKSTEAEIELLHDINMVETVRSGIRGGMSFIGKRLLELTHMDDLQCSFDATTPSTFVTIDA